MFYDEHRICCLSLALKSKYPQFEAMKKLLLILWLQILLGILPSPAALANPIAPPSCAETRPQKELFGLLLYLPPILGIGLIGTSTVLRIRLRNLLSDSESIE